MEQIQLALNVLGQLSDHESGLEGPALLEKLRSSGKPIRVAPNDRVPLDVLEKTFGRLRDHGIQNLQIGGNLAWQGRLFCLGGTDVIEPAIELDRRWLMQIASESRLLPAISSEQRPLTYWLLLSDTGKILGIEQLRGPRIPAVEQEPMRSRVISAAMKGSVPIPFAVYVELECRI